MRIFLLAALLLAGCSGHGAALLPAATPIPITPATSCTIGGLTISGPSVTGCGP